MPYRPGGADSQRRIARASAAAAVNVATRIQQPDPQNPGQFIPLTRGKIAIEIEYAEIWFRRIEVRRSDKGPDSICCVAQPVLHVPREPGLAAARLE